MGDVGVMKMRDCWVILVLAIEIVDWPDGNVDSPNELGLAASVAVFWVIRVSFWVRSSAVSSLPDMVALPSESKDVTV